MTWLSSITYVEYCIIGALLLILLYIRVTRNNNYFAKRNIPFKKPVPLFGNQARNIFRLESIADFILNMYNAFPDSKVTGIFQFTSPNFMVKDPELLKLITVKDFDHFMDHINFLPNDAEPLFQANLVALKGQKWKHMRSLLSPAFTSSKMKGMFHLMTQCGQQLVDHLEVLEKESGKDILEVDMKDLFTRFTNDVIATTAFGISCDSLKNPTTNNTNYNYVHVANLGNSILDNTPTNEFYMCGKDITNFTGIAKTLVFLGYMFCPKVLKLMNLRLFTKESSDFLYKTVRETIEIREKNGIIRPDMIHLLMQAKKGELRNENEATNDLDNDASKSKPQKYDLTDTDITAQAMIFFLAGFETASVLIGFASLLLAIHEDIQTRLQEEIDQTLEECGGTITYDALHNMKYLDMVVSETLRMYPPAVALDRECVKPYTLPASENTPAIHLKPKDKIIVPVYGIHHDPQYFQNPETFDPERFSEQNKHSIKPFTYMPFGLGPRSCIGNRFALMEDKIALVYLLSRFRLHVTDKSSVPIKLTRNAFQMAPDKGFWIGLKSRKKRV